MDEIYKISIHKQVGDKLLKSLNIKFFNEKLFIYKDGVYTNDTHIIEQEILKIYVNATKSLRKEILEYLKIKLNDSSLTPINNYINFKNGLYDLKNKKFLKHTPEIFTINQINANYIVDIKPDENVNKFLDDITQNNPIKRMSILQIIGYSMTTSVEFQKAFIFYGATAENGKSTLLQLITSLIGRNNICHISIQELEKGRFYAAEIENKLLNTVAELPRSNLESVNRFKALVTGDELSVENKYEARHIIVPYAKHIYTTNELPSVDENTNGYYRRLNILTFDAHFSDEEKRKFDINKLLCQNAIDYLAYISLLSYLDLLNTRHFSNEEDSNKIIENYKMENDSVNKYIYNSIHFTHLINNNKTISRKSLYTDYKNFCNDFNYTPVGKITFYDRAKATDLFNTKKINGENYFEYK